MKRAFLVLLIFVVAAASYIYLQPYSSNRFRLTVEVDTPDGLKSGSSVIETVSSESGGLPDARGVRSTVKGEAIFVDLGHGKNLIAILGWGKFGEDENKIFYLTRAALAPNRKVEWKDEHKLKGRGDLPPSFFPTLITFSDLENPATAKVVSPAELAATFGPGYSLRRMTLETTSAPVTRGIEKKLLWWSLPGRPASIAKRAWREGVRTGVSQVPEDLFQKG
jgi:hypothetical protein